MEPNKFEDSIREKLEKRTIEPAERAWGKLSRRLDTQVEKRNNKPYWWLGLAASVIGLLFVVSNVFEKDINLNDAPIIGGTVDKQNETKVIESQNKDDIEYAVPNIEKSVVQETEELPEEKKPNKILNSVLKAESVVVSVDKNGVSEKQDISVANVELLNESLSFEDQKIQDVVAQVQTLKEKNIEVSLADIDGLLNEAQKEIAQNRLYNETHGAVDANALLQDVEDELDQSFRSKVFEAIKASYNKVKTTVAQRNE